MHKRHPSSCDHRQAGGKSVMTSVQRTELHRLLRAKGEFVREVYEWNKTNTEEDEIKIKKKTRR